MGTGSTSWPSRELATASTALALYFGPRLRNKAAAPWTSAEVLRGELRRRRAERVGVFLAERAPAALLDGERRQRRLARLGTE